MTKELTECYTLNKMTNLKRTNTMEQYNKRKNIYFYSLLVIFAIGITVISGYIGTKAKWWYFLIGFFVCRGITNFLMYLYVNKRGF